MRMTAGKYHDAGPAGQPAGPGPAGSGPAPLTRDQAFQALRANLEVTGLREAAVSARCQLLREQLSAQLAVDAAFVTGSCRRHTLIAPLDAAVIDVLAVLRRRHRSRSSLGVIERVAEVLAAASPAGAVRRTGRAVTVTGGEFAVDVLPAFARPWWSSHGGWEIGDPAGLSWLGTNPDEHVRLSASADRAHGGQLVPRIRQLKAWNRQAGEPLRSFHLEVLAWSVFGTSAWRHERVRSDWASARRFFAEARDKLSSPLYDPAGSGSAVGGYLDEGAASRAAAAMTAAHDLCLTAETAVRDDDLRAMHQAYGRIFGPCYPG